MNMHRTTRIGIVVLAVILTSCGGGDNVRPLSDSELDQVRSQPQIQRLRGITESADLLVIPGIHGKITLSIDGQQESERLDAPVYCSGSTCFDFDGNSESLDEIFDSPTSDIRLTDVTLGRRDGFDTIITSAAASVSEIVDDDNITARVDAVSYGMWGQHGYAEVVIIDAPFSGQIEEHRFTGDIDFVSAKVIGNSSGTNPVGAGKATWSGHVEAAAIRSFERRTGTVYLEIANLARPYVDVDVRIGGRSIGSSDWKDIPLNQGKFEVGRFNRDYLSGSFHGSTHSEAYGAFDTTAYVGSFGAKRD